jgi:hypothetical protein
VVTQFSLLNMAGRYDDYSTDHDLSCLGKSFHGHAALPLAAVEEGNEEIGPRRVEPVGST